MTSTLPDKPQVRRKTGRTAVTVLLIISLIATAVTRDWTATVRDTDRGAGRIGGVNGAGSASTSLNALPSYATALLLGGLRGPLVMILWPKSESQKQERNLEDFDTEVEWIRLLQPEFDTVHLFQIWNKAYNISVQMASLANKYSTILSAIDYAREIDAQRPDDINILMATAGVWGEKLGNSEEKAYYMGRVRLETQTLALLEFPASRTDEFRAKATGLGWIEDESPLNIDSKTQRAEVLLPRGIADYLSQTFSGPDVSRRYQTAEEARHRNTLGRRVRLDPMLDENGNLLPELLTPRYPRPADLPADQQWYDGSQLQFLAAYQPFPYGISTRALGFNYYKRSQLLSNLWNEDYIQSGAPLVDSEPAMELKTWASEEWERGLRAELRMWDKPIHPDDAVQDLMPMTRAIGLSEAIKNPAARAEAIFSYRRAAKLMADSRAEFHQHLSKYPGDMAKYDSHVDDTIANEQLELADADYLEATTATGNQRKALIQSAAGHYVAAEQHLALIILKYYISDNIASHVYPPDPRTGRPYLRASVEAIDPGQYVPLMAAALDATYKTFVDPSTGKYLKYYDEHYDERPPYLEGINRCGARLVNLRAAGL